MEINFVTKQSYVPQTAPQLIKSKFKPYIPTTVSRGGGGSSKKDDNSIEVGPSGGVQVGAGLKTTTYIGNAIIPNTGGLTANQQRAVILKQAQSQGLIKQQDFGRVTVIQTRTYRQAEINKLNQTENKRINLGRAKEYPLQQTVNPQATKQDTRPRTFLSPVSTVEPVIRPKGLAGFRSDFSQGQNLINTRFIRGESSIGTRALSFGVGFSTAIIDVTEGTKQLITNPMKVIAGTPSFIKEEATSIGAGLKSGFPEQSLGRITGFYVGGKGVEYVVKSPVAISDIVRTKTTIKVPVADVVAPEYFAGQKYPSIKRGQTAGQLLQEFKQPQQYGVTSLRGFTASPKPFNKLTRAGGGSSELAGVYQAPKISPAFLRVTSGEKGLFSFNPFGTLRPSATIIYPKAFELTPLVKFEQKGLAPLKQTKNFFTNKAEIGKSYVSFVKTEKESIIPEETPLTLVNKRFSFDFEKRKIPIYEFEVGEIKAESINKVNKRVYTPEEVSKLSYSRVGSRGVFSSLDIIKVVKSYPSSSSRSSRKIFSSISSGKSLASSNKSSSSLYVSPRSSRTQGISYATPRESYNPVKSSTSYSIFTPYKPMETISYPKSTKSTTRYSVPKGKYNVSVRRFGKFKTVASGISLGRAIGIGVDVTGKTLARSFKVTQERGGFSEGGFRTPKGYYRKKSGIFIEKTSRALNLPSETISLGSYRKR